MFPTLFEKASVLDVGSLDINGNNRFLFKNCKKYVGIDLVAGKNVDVICNIQQYKANEKYDVVISTEMLEHDCNWQQSISCMYNLVKPLGLLLLTCAGEGRREHGTHKFNPQDSPGTLNYYCNISISMLKNALQHFQFLGCDFSKNDISHDTYFWGVKK